jgi:hypothetical protein
LPELQVVVVVAPDQEETQVAPTRLAAPHKLKTGIMVKTANHTQVMVAEVAEAEVGGMQL